MEFICIFRSYLSQVNPRTTKGHESNTGLITQPPQGSHRMGDIEQTSPPEPDRKPSLILALPTELQIEILSYFTFECQILISAAIVDRRWRQVLTDQEFFRKRFYDQPQPLIFVPRGIHRLVKYDEKCRSWMGCIITARARIKCYFIGRTPFEKPMEEHDVSKCPFWDEPLFDPNMLEGTELRSYISNFQVKIEFMPLNHRYRDTFGHLSGVCSFNKEDLADITIRQLVRGVVEDIGKRVGRSVPEDREYRLMFGMARTGIRVAMYINYN